MRPPPPEDPGRSRGTGDGPGAVPPEPAAFHGVTPILRVADFEASAAYYRDALGFELAWRDHGFGCVRRGEVSLMLCEGSQGCAGTWSYVSSLRLPARTRLPRRCATGGTRRFRVPSMHLLAPAFPRKPLQQTEWARKYGQCSDRFGIQWMANYAGSVRFAEADAE